MGEALVVAEVAVEEVEEVVEGTAEDDDEEEEEEEGSGKLVVETSFSGVEGEWSA